MPPRPMNCHREPRQYSYRDAQVKLLAESERAESLRHVLFPQRGRRTAIGLHSWVRRDAERPDTLGGRDADEPSISLP